MTISSLSIIVVISLIVQNQLSIALCYAQNQPIIASPYAQKQLLATSLKTYIQWFAYAIGLTRHSR